MNREDQDHILGAVFSLTYSLYPQEMTTVRSHLVRCALSMLGEADAHEQVDGMLFALHQSKYDLNPGCQCLMNNGYYPDDFTDNFRKLDRQDEIGEEARALLDTLKAPHPDWDAALMYCAIRAVYNKEYDAARIRQIHAQLKGEMLPNPSND